MNSSAMYTALQRLGELLAAAGERYSVVAIGGAAMNLLGYVSRTTTDVDLIAFGGDAEGAPIAPPPDPLPEPLLRAARTVARDLGLNPAWLNAGPASQWRTGLPPGLESRLHWRAFGALRVGLADRRDLIFLKLYAAADDVGPASVHFQDLVALRPTGAELEDATAWVAAQDPSLAHILAQVAAHVHYTR